MEVRSSNFSHPLTSVKLSLNAVFSEHMLVIHPLVSVLFACRYQLIIAFEKAMVLMDPVPGEEHKKVSADYIKCLSKVSATYLMSVSLPQKVKDC